MLVIAQDSDGVLCVDFLKSFLGLLHTMKPWFSRAVSRAVSIVHPRLEN